MAIEKVRDFYGIRYVIPYNLTTYKPLVVLRAIGELSYENTIEAVELVGGHADAPWDIEYGQPTPAFSGTLREYPAGLFQIMETTTVTENAAESNGSASSPTNHQGTSVYDASNGISAVSVNASQKANLKFGRYVFVATAAQEVDIYLIGNTDSFLDMEGMVYDGLDCSSPGTIDIDDLGIQVVVSGTAAFTIGDTMSAEVRPENTGSTEVLVGAGTTPDNFGLRCIFPKKTDGVMHWIDVFNVAGRGMPWQARSREFSEFDVNMRPMARSSDGAVYQMVRALGV
jgi:hypothetical protein